ncbi:MAG: winged helix-turn-helix domain-containing protein [Acidobacteriota bacterium]
MSYRDAALEILRKERRAMTAKEIIAIATACGLIANVGRTPDASLAGRLYTDIQRHGEESPFIQVGPRKYALREWMEVAPTIASPQVSPLREKLLKLSLELLREKFYGSIMSLDEELRARFISELIAGMRAAGVNVTNHLLLLGVHSGRSEAASATDIALLLRYYRINNPPVFDLAVDIIDRFPTLSTLLQETEREATVITSRTRTRNSRPIAFAKASKNGDE